MNEYNINVLTNKDLRDELFVRDLLIAWSRDIDSRLEPEFFGLGEPVRHSFKEERIESAVDLWVTNGMGLMLKRRNKFKYLAEVDWWQREETLDRRLFPWSCRVWLTLRSGDDLALKFFKFLIEWFEPAFGYISTDEQVKDKHFVCFEDKDNTYETNVGLDINEKLPGIYWITYFGDWAVEKIGAKKFELLTDPVVEKFKEGVLLKAYMPSTKIGTADAIQAENQILQSLGREHFFDKTLFDLRTLL